MRLLSAKLIPYSRNLRSLRDHWLFGIRLVILAAEPLSNLAILPLGKFSLFLTLNDFITLN